MTIDQKKQWRILGILLFSFLLFPILAYNNEFFTDFDTQETYLEGSPMISSTEVNGRYLSATQHANISKTYGEEELPTNISFNLAPGWTSKNVTINYEGVSQKKNWVTNGDFDSDMSGWTYYESGTYWSNEGYYGSGNPTGCVGFRASEMGEGDIAYFEQNITIPDIFSSDDAVISTDVYMSFSGGRFNGCLFVSLIIDEIEINNTISAEVIQYGTWVPLSIIYDPIMYGHVLPNTASVRVGVYGYEDDSIISWQEFYFDNIKYEPWTKPNTSDIVLATDIEFTQNYTYFNTDYGEGYSFIDVERYRSVSDNILFTIHQNLSNVIDFKIDSYTISSPAQKLINSTILGSTGSKYTTGSNISWYTELSISSIPPDYTSWVELEKPTDWFFTSIIDGYESDKTSSCIGKDFGDPKLIIPSSILGAGLWKFNAISTNYITESHLEVWNGSDYEEGNRFNHGDNFIVKLTLNDSIVLPNTVINCSIFYSNGSLFINQSFEPISYTSTFGSFTIGNNMTVGNYIVKLEWFNNQSSASVDEVGYSELEFTIWHYTNLTAVDSYIEKIAGDPCLIKINYTDYDFNTYITFATVTYNSTLGQSGEMTYIGSGTYILDLDTSALPLGDYFFSFNASKPFYHNQTAINLINLKIIAQPLAIETPGSVISGSGNDYINCQINVTGAFSGSLIWPANITTDWENPYTVSNHNNGTFTLNFSTWNLPTQGIIETFTVSVVASKTYYGNASSFIAMTVYPIDTNIEVNNSNIVIDLGNKAYVNITYTEEGSGSIILGANCSITWPSIYNISFNGQGFVVWLDTANLSIDTYVAIIKLEKPGFETAYKSISVFINRMDIEVHIIKDTIEASVGDTITIKINLTEPGTGIFIENASIFYSWDFGIGYFDYAINGTYELELDLREAGNYKMTLIILKEGSIYKTKEFSFFIVITTTPQPNYIMWVIIYGLLAGIGLLGVLSLRTYVILPYKRKKKAELLSKTQRYKDIRNIEAIVISNRESGLHMYSKSYYLIKDHQNELLSGFIQAISLISSEIVGKERLEEIIVSSDKVKGVEKIIELDFKHFNFFISDYKDIRIIFILKDKASDRFKKKIAEFLASFDRKFPNKFKNWNGEINELSKVFPVLINKHFQLYFREEFKINPILDKDRITKEEELSKMAVRLFNVIVSMTRTREDFHLEEALEMVHEKNKDKLIKALEELIGKEILIPSNE